MSHISAGWLPWASTKTGAYLLTITHSGRGVFSTRTWERLARDSELAYPQAGVGIGIGPIDGQSIPVTEMDFNVGEMRVVNPDGRIILECFAVWYETDNDKFNAGGGYFATIDEAISDAEQRVGSTIRWS